MLAYVFAETAASDVAEAAAEAANNPILPTVNEMFWTLVFFAILWALMKFVLLPPIMRGFEARTAKLREDEGAAEAAEIAATERVREYEAGLAGARSEAVAIIEAARAEGDAQRREVVGAAEAEVASLRAAAAEEIAAAKARARAELTGNITDIAVGAASAVLDKQVDRSTSSRVVDDYVAGQGRN